MPSRFERHNFFAGFKFARVFKPVTKLYGHPEASEESLRYSIEILHAELEKKTMTFCGGLFLVNFTLMSMNTF